MRKSIRFWILLLALFGLGLGESFAGEKIWVGLYLAENKTPPASAKVAPEKLHQQLHEVFGFKHYQLLKSDEMELHNEWEQWFVPRRDFFLRVEPLRKKEDEPRVIDYEIYKDGFIVAKGTYQPHVGMPLFINGPDFHDGRLIFVVKSRPPKTETEADE